MREFDLITVGAAIIDAFLRIHNADTHCKVNEQARELCIRYGQKIEVESCDFLLGGNACNVGIGAARLGLNTALCAEIGDDEFSEKITTTLRKENVDTSLVKKTPQTASSFAIGLNFRAERTLFVSHVKRNHNFSLDNVTTRWVYLTSIGEEWQQAYHTVAEFIKQKQIKLAFAPGSRQLAKGAGNFSYLFPLSDFVILNKEESQLVVGGEKKQDEKEEIIRLLFAMQKLGSKKAVVTDGKKGSYALDTDKTIYFLEEFDAPVVEKTGAGDAYATGFLAASMQGLDMPTAMQWGTLNAASVIGKIGAQQGLLTKEAMTKMLAEHKEFKARKIREF